MRHQRQVIRDNSTMGQASFDEVPPGVKDHKMEGNDEGFSGGGRNGSKGSEVRMKQVCKDQGANCPHGARGWRGLAV